MVHGHADSAQTEQLQLTYMSVTSLSRQVIKSCYTPLSHVWSDSRLVYWLSHMRERNFFFILVMLVLWYGEPHSDGWKSDFYSMICFLNRIAMHLTI